MMSGFFSRLSWLLWSCLLDSSMYFLACWRLRCRCRRATSSARVTVTRVTATPRITPTRGVRVTSTGVISIESEWFYSLQKIQIHALSVVNLLILITWPLSLFNVRWIRASLALFLTKSEYSSGRLITVSISIIKGCWVSLFR